MDFVGRYVNNSAFPFISLHWCIKRPFADFLMWVTVRRLDVCRNPAELCHFLGSRYLRFDNVFGVLYTFLQLVSAWPHAHVQPSSYPFNGRIVLRP